MLTRLRELSLRADFAPLVLFAAPAFASAPVDHTVAVAPRADPVFAALPGGRAFALPGIGGDFVFVTGGQFVELASGEARLTGVLARLGDPRQRLLADLSFHMRVAPGDSSYPPAGSPTLELQSGAYSAQGGSVDPSQWHYWMHVDGSFTGLGSLRGARLSVQERGPAFQSGIGANGRSLGMGVEGFVRASVLAQPSSGPALPAIVDGAANLDLESKFVLKAQDAVSDPSVAQHLSAHAFYLSALGDDWRFVAGGELEETSDGTGRMTGVIARLGQPERQLFVDMAFSSRTNPGETGHAPAGSPKEELLASAYFANGGPVDPGHWYYYESFAGTLTGLRALAGVDYALARRGPAFQIGIGANGKNLAWGGSGWLDLALLRQPRGSSYPQSLVGDVNVDFNGDESECATKAEALVGVGHLGGHALYLAGVGDDFVFQPGGQFTELSDGTATLQGVLARVSNPAQRFLASAEFSGRIDSNDVGYPPPMSPKMELVASAYVSNGGGPVDTTTWHYYTAMTGTLLGESAYVGAVLEIDPMGPAFQVGLGANGKNLDYGGSGWLNVQTISQPHVGPNFPSTLGGDFNFDFDDDCPNCATRARRDSAATYNAGGHAFYLPGIAQSLVFAPGAVFEERDDGTARLTGVIYHERRPSARFAVDLTFSSRVDPGEAGFAPSGSPKLELYPAMYVPSGPIDPATWHYYHYTDGFLVGQGALNGALLEITRAGPAFQVGLGANGKNAGFGASGWLNVHKLSNPTNGRNLPSDLMGDINVNVNDACN